MVSAYFFTLMIQLHTHAPLERKEDDRKDLTAVMELTA